MSMHSSSLPHGDAAAAFGAGVETTGPPRWLAAVAGVVSVAVGVAALVWPGPTLLVVGILFGAYFTIWGIGLLMRGAGDATLPGGLRILDVLMGAIALLVGFALMVRPGASVQTAAWVLGFWWTLSGALQIVRGLIIPIGRAWNLLWGVVGLGAGIIILASPQIALGTLVLIVGIGLIMQGLFELALAVSRPAAEVAA
jgi:uncharacterized membrane protein HdeD (DUF308 family)